MILTKKFILKPNKTEKNIFRSLTFASAKLWNIGNYEKKNYEFLGFEKYPNRYDQKKRFKSEYWYKSLPSQTAQETLNMLEKSWKSYFKLKKTGGIQNPKPPRFKKNVYNIKFLNNRVFDSLEQLQLELFDYVNWYNNIRIHGSLGYISPVEYKSMELN